MQTYSTMKGKSNSDDGKPTFSEHTVHERDVYSDDGFDSFPAYRRAAGAEISDSSSESGPEHDADTLCGSFYSADSQAYDYVDARSHRADLGDEVLPPPEAGIAATEAPKKKKKKAKKKKGKGAKVEKGEGVHAEEVAVRAEQEVDLEEPIEAPKEKKKKPKKKKSVKGKEAQVDDEEDEEADEELPAGGDKCTGTGDPMFGANFDSAAIALDLFNTWKETAFSDFLGLDKKAKKG